MRMPFALYLVALLFPLLAAGAQAPPDIENEDSASETTGAFNLIPELSIVMPTSFVLNTGNFIVPYSNEWSGIPLFSIGGEIPVAKAGPVDFRFEARVGYAYKADTLTAYTPQGTPATDNIQLHWVPMTGAFRTVYHIPGIHFVTPSLTMGGGVQWLHQSGSLPGITQGFWLPFVYVTPSINFMAGHREDDWFGGFSFGTTYRDSFNSLQVLRGFSFDLSVSIWL